MESYRSAVNTSVAEASEQQVELGVSRSMCIARRALVRPYS